MNETQKNKDEPKKIPKFSSFKAHLRQAQNAFHEKQIKRTLLDQLKEKEPFIKDKSEKKENNYQIRYEKVKTIEENKLFVVDLSGDINNVRYGKNHLFSIPYYQRSGYGRVLGCEEHVRLWFYPENPREIILSPFPNYNYYWELTKLNSDKDAQSIKETEEFYFNQIQIEENYISLEIEAPDTISTVKNTETHFNNIDSTSNKVKSNIQDILDVWKEGDPQLELKELSRKIEESPLDHELWLELVDKQDKILRTDGKKKSREEQLSIGDVKLKILKKALSYSPDNEKLLLKYISIITLIWEPQKINAKWNEILKKTSSLSLWKKYLDFCQTNSISFTYSECLQNFQNSLKILKETLKNEKCLEKKETIEEIILYILARIWFYMKEAGYLENSIASIQALIEFNFFRPDTSSGDIYNDYLQEFEEFWESEVPRFGENGAKGWKNYHNIPQNIISSENYFSDSLVSNNEDIHKDTEDKYIIWYKQETAKSFSINPKRSIDTDNENDPYSVILFSDIKQLLHFFISDKIRLNLIYFSLHFFGFSVHKINKTSSDLVLLDSFMHNFSSIDLFNWFWPDNYISFESSQSFNENITNSCILGRLGNPIQFKLRNWPVTIDTLFSIDKTWHQNFDYEESYKHFIKRCFEQLENILDNDIFSMLHLLFQNYYLPSKKFSNVKLWCAYAQLEYLNGNMLETRKIFLNILENVKPDHTERFYDHIIAYKLWAEIEMRNNEVNNSIKILISMVENEFDIKTMLSNNQKIYSNSILLKAQKSFQHLIRLTLSFKNYKMLRLFTECYALLNYLTKSLDSALEIYHQTKSNFSDLVNSSSIEYEQLLISELKLLYYCLQTLKVFKISILQDRAKTALLKFPNNCIFLSMFIWTEAKLLFKAKIYHYFEKNIFKVEEPSFVIFLSAIWTELYINSYKINMHAIRYLFERAVENPNTKSDLIIWKLYIQFEIQYGALEKGKAILYRAIRDCPWSKNLILFAFNELRSQFNPKELTKLYNTMIEREFRISVDLDVTKDNQEMNYLPSIHLPQDISSDEMIE
ncbi:hypothetical protein PCANB_000993 [Pneumocystis canis]|nr:hypothetical protein PCANB_000993 [Pneumocystis canis]